MDAAAAERVSWAPGGAASRYTNRYLGALVGAILLDIPAIYLVREWHFGMGFFAVLAGLTASWFALLYGHHRKHLRIGDSKPLLPSDVNPGPLAYLVLSAVTASMQAPFAMLLVQWARRG
jgi:hypothetical protein